MVRLFPIFAEPTYIGNAQATDTDSLFLQPVAACSLLLIGACCCLFFGEANMAENQWRVGLQMHVNATITQDPVERVYCSQISLLATNMLTPSTCDYGTRGSNCATRAAALAWDVTGQ